LVESRLYAVLLGEKSITHYYGADIVFLIELGVFHPDDYIYCFTLSAWIKAVQCEEISTYLTLNAYRRSSELIIAAPDFNPPPPPEKTPYSVKDLLKGGIISQDEESKKRTEFLEDQFRILSEENLRLSELVNGKVPAAIRSANQSDLNDEGEFEELKREWSLRLESFQKDIEESREKLEVSQAELRLAKDENKKLAQAIKQQSLKGRKYAKESDLAKKENILISEDNRALKQLLRTKEAQLLTLEKNHKQSKKKIENLSSLSEERERENILEEQRLIGESFKVINSPQWMIKREGQEKGPYRFSDVTEWYAKNLVSGRTLVKRISEKTYNRLEDIYEFNTRVIERYEDIGGTFDSVYYIKRTDFRAPFYDVAVIDNEGDTERAQCTSLSIGGCFFELKTLEGIQVNSVLKCEIKADYLSGPISAKIIVKNIKEGRNKGIGCQFLDLEDHEVATIEEFVTAYLESQEVSSPKKAA
jgi:hypothetical protein